LKKVSKKKKKKKIEKKVVIVSIPIPIPHINKMKMMYIYKILLTIVHKGNLGFHIDKTKIIIYIQKNQFIFKN
jgi:hypothetical protein